MMQAYEPWSYRSDLLDFLSKQGFDAIEVALLRIDAKFCRRDYWSAGPGRSRKLREALYCDVYEALATVIFKEHPSFDATLLTVTIPRLVAAAMGDWKWDDSQVRLAPGSVQKWLSGAVSTWTANLMEREAYDRQRMAAVEVELVLTETLAPRAHIEPRPVDRGALYADAATRHPEWKKSGGKAAWCKKYNLSYNDFMKWRRDDTRSSTGKSRYPDTSPFAIKCVKALQE